jgi:hypothetical protein
MDHGTQPIHEESRIGAVAAHRSLPSQPLQSAKPLYDRGEIGRVTQWSSPWVSGGGGVAEMTERLRTAMTAIRARRMACMGRGMGQMEVREEYHGTLMGLGLLL